MKRPHKILVEFTQQELDAVITAVQLTDDEGAYARANPGPPVAALRRAERKMWLAEKVGKVRRVYE